MDLKSCVDYHILEEELTNKQLDMIDEVIEHYVAYAKKYDNGDKDIIGEYSMIYGNGYLIDWYEGLMTTEEFITEEKAKYY